MCTVILLILVPCCVKDGKHEDAKEFLGLYLDALQGALDEEVVELRTNIGINKADSATGVNELEEEAQLVQIGLRESNDTWCANLSFSAPGSTSLTDAWTTNRQVQSSHPSRAFSAEDLIPPYARQSQLNTFAVTAWRSDSVHTVQEALVSLGLPVRVGQSSLNEANKQVHLEPLPWIFILHLEQFLYGVATEGITKVSEPVQIAPEFEIPLGIIFFFLFHS